MLEITHRNLADVHVLDMVGKFRSNTERVFWNAVQEAVVEGGARKVVLNFQDVVECDSFGISELLRVHNSIANLRGELYLVNLNDLVRKVLTITKVIDLLTIREDEDSALEELSATSTTTAQL